MGCSNGKKAIPVIDEEEQNQSQCTLNKFPELEKTVEKNGRDNSIVMTNLPYGKAELLPNSDLRDKFFKNENLIKYFNHLLENQSTKDITEDYTRDVIPLLEELFQSMGVTLEVSNQDSVISRPNYNLRCTALTENELNRTLGLLFLEMSIYPSSFIRKTKLKTISLYHSVDIETSTYKQYRAGSYDIPDKILLLSCKETQVNYLKLVLHHEFFHFVDYCHNNTFADSHWEQLNTTNFHYGNGGAYEREWKPLDPSCKGFLNFYSTTAIEEDKAEIFQTILLQPDYALSHNDEIVRKKVMYLQKWLKKYDSSLDDKFFGNLISFRELLTNKINNDYGN